MQNFPREWPKDNNRSKQNHRKFPGKHYPFTKEGNVPLYVHKKSNHPPSILKNIPDSINRRLSETSSDRECFDNAKTVYQEALNKSGYNYNLSYKESHNDTQRSRRNRPRNILWYNPPFSKNVKTNVGKCFLALIDQHFPKSNPLHKIFNRNTLKLSYSCMSNVKTIISGIQARAPWTKNATTKTSFTKPRSRHQPQERHTLGFVTQLSS